MAKRHAPSSARRHPRAPTQRGQGKRPRGIETERPRRSARLEGISRLLKSSERRESEHPSPNPPAGGVHEGSAPTQILHETSKLHQKRYREAGNSPQDQDRPPSKRLRISSPSCKTKGEQQKEAESDTSKNNAGPVETWIHTNKWPSRFFQQDSQIREELEHDSWLEEQMEPPARPTQVVQYVEINGYRYPQPIRKPPSSVRRKQSDSNLTSSSDQKQRETKSSRYRDTRYTTLLEAKGSYLREFDDDDIPKDMDVSCQKLLDEDQLVPRDSLFRDDLFKKTCLKIVDRNEAMVIQDITRLIVPSAQHFAIYGAKHLNQLIESVNEGWSGSIPVEGPRPQPDYSVGFRRSAFTDEQLKRLDPIIGTVFDNSFFVATYRMYFPFLTCEVKCGASALDIADRQNAHSMTIAVRGVVELYRAVNREMELHGEILAFSISHDHKSVRIYGHYAMIDKSKTTFYRHTVDTFDFTGHNGKDKWKAYKFTKNVYDVWMPIHLKRICSVIDQLPSSLNFEVSQGSEVQSTEASGLSQQVGGLLLEQPQAESASGASRNESELAPIVPQTATPELSVSQGKEQAAPKRPKRKHTAK